MIQWFSKIMMGQLEVIEKKLKGKEGFVQPGPYARKSFDFLAAGGMSVPSDTKEKKQFFFKVLPMIAKSMFGNFHMTKSLKIDPSKPRKMANPQLLEKIEAFCTTHGVAMVGYTKLNPNYIFDHTAVKYDNVIVLAHEMNEQRIQEAPSMNTEVMIQETYKDVGGTANKLARFLRMRGYGAHASHSVRGNIILPPVAQDAGLGWVGRNGVLLTEKLGPRVRLAAVMCSIENLPFADKENNPNEWIRNFCDMCGRCIKKCPPKDLYEKTIQREGGALTHVDNKLCYPYFHKNYGCGVCLKVCPFSKSDFRVYKKAFERNQRKTEKRNKKVKKEIL